MFFRLALLAVYIMFYVQIDVLRGMFVSSAVEVVEGLLQQARPASQSLSLGTSYFPGLRHL